MDFRIGDTKVQWRLPVRGCPIQVTSDTEDRIAYIDLKRVHKQFQNILGPKTLAEVIAALKAGYLTVIVDYGTDKSKLADELLSEDSQRKIWERAGIDPNELTITKLTHDKSKETDSVVVFHRREQAVNNSPLDSRMTSLPPPPVSNVNITHTAKEEILLEGYGPWEEELRKAMFLIDQDKLVVLKRVNPSGFEESTDLELKTGITKDEVLIDLLDNAEMKCDEILGPVLNYFLCKGRIIAIDYGIQDGDEGIEIDINNACSSYNSMPPDVQFYKEEREFDKKRHYILILKREY